MAGTGMSLNWGGLDRITNGLAAQAARTQALMAGIGETLVAGVHDRFEKGEGPDGEKWPRAGRGGQTLVDTGRLRSSIGYEAAGDLVVVGTNMEYARIHQEGGEIRPKSARALAIPQPGGGVRLVKKVNIPPRPYIGISKEDKEEVADMIAAHFAAGLQR